MNVDQQAEFEQALKERGDALAVGLGFVFGEYVENDEVKFEVLGTQTCEPDEKPEGLPEKGVLLKHQGTLASPQDERFAIGWFIGETLQGVMAAKNPDDLPAKLGELANEVADNLTTDKYDLLESSGMVSEDLWSDFLSGDLPPTIIWLRFRLDGLESGPEEVLLAWPISVVERLFGAEPGEQGMEMTAVEESSIPQADSTDDSSPQASSPTDRRVLPPGVNRMLNTEVPVIVTVAHKKFSTSRLLDLKVGSIIEFDRGCEELLEISVNRLLIGMGEAVKVGSNFGLRVTEIISKEDRLENLRSI